jgi:hypothetical protein
MIDRQPNLNPTPSTLNPKPDTPNPEIRWIGNDQDRATFKQQADAGVWERWNKSLQQVSTRNPKPETRNPNSEPLNPKP